MLGHVESSAPQNGVQPVHLRVIETKPAIGVIGLGHVGAVTCGCLAAIGHRVVGVDLDVSRCADVAAGRSPMPEAGLDALLAEAVASDLLDTTPDIAASVATTDMTFVSVGTPTGDDGGCDLRQIESVADALGAALRDHPDFHIVVLRCSVPPGTTAGVLAARVEAVSGRKMGVDFGVAYVPEFLREGMAVADFQNPPKTVIGASDAQTARRVARVFAALGPTPLHMGIEAAELVKYVDNVWHATKVVFANEVGRLAKSMGIDGREVMDTFCKDTKLNISAHYMKPGFAYGGSCLPKEVRAVHHLGRAAGVDLPLVASLEASNAAQVVETLRLVRQTGARRVGILGVAFKAGTADLRESPTLDVMRALLDDGVSIDAHDALLDPADLAERTSRYVDAPQADFASRVLPALLRPSPESVLATCDAVIVTQNIPAYRKALARCAVPVIDVAQALEAPVATRGDTGIGW